ALRGRAREHDRLHPVLGQEPRELQRTLHAGAADRREVPGEEQHRDHERASSLTTRAGAPTASVRAGTSWLTTLPAPTTAPLPMPTPGPPPTLWPRHAPSSLTT